MRFASLLAAVAFVLAGCSGSVTDLADGGRARINCDPVPLTASVLVLDRGDNPAAQATVSAEYLSYAKADTLTTDSRGVVLVKDKYGPGIVRVQGSLNDLITQVAEFNFSGADCTTAVTPPSLTLKLQ